MRSDPPSLNQDLRKQLLRRSNRKGLVRLVGHLTLLLLSAVALGSNLDNPLLLLTLPVYATVLIFLFAPLHESVHFTAFKSKSLNNLVAAVAGFILFLPAQYFRAFHYNHHRHTQDPELDPELAKFTPMKFKSWFWRVTGLPNWLEQWQVLYAHARGRVSEAECRFIEKHKHAMIIREARLHLAGYASLLILSGLFNSSFLWWFWILPLLLGQPVLRLFLLAEHTGCDFSNDMLANSRTTKTSPLIRFLSWNMGYHAEHHFLAAVPFHALPRLHAVIGHAVKHKGDGYLEVNREILAQLE